MGLPVVVTLVTTGLLAVVSAEPREQFVFRLLSVYAAGPDQATAADRDKNDKITDTEFLQSLYFFTEEKRDRRVTQAEFVDGYRRQFGLPAELLVIMFDLLDDFNDDGNTRQGTDSTNDNRNNKFFDVFSKLSAGSGMFANNHQNRGDGVLTPRDVTVRKFVGDTKQANKEEYRKSLLKWVAAAADRLYSINYQPHIPGNPWDMEFDYERWFTNVDHNNDSLLSFKELSDEFRRYNPDGRVKRSRWVERNMKQYSDKEWLSTVVFDYWDKNKDLRLDDLDVGLILKEADRNRDMRVTTIEFHRFMEKYNKRARRRLATPVRPVMYDCPSPWWQSFGCRPRVDATRAAMDMDDNFDGWITQGELRKRVSYYDRNGDGWATRMEVMMVEAMRYGVKGPVASIMFDVYDRNGDGRFDNNDVQYMLSNGRVLCFCDARRAVLDLVKLSEKFSHSPQARGPAGSLRNAMRWQMKRQWQWRQQAERLWHNIWGEGGGSGRICREGDCTGKDWRGGTWYSPFDWRQKNRVPENFLQWSYLRDIPRTITYPQGLGMGGGQFFPGRKPSWNKPQWLPGDNRNIVGNPGFGGNPNDGSRGGGIGFPLGGPGQRPGSGQFPSGSGDAMPIPPNFMPNPARTPTRPGSFPRTSNNVPFFSGNFPPSLDGSDNSAEEFWNRLLAGLDNETSDGWDPSWMKPGSNAWQQVFSKDGRLPPWAQTSRKTSSGNEAIDNRNWLWNRKSGTLSLADIFKDGDSGTTRPNLPGTEGKQHQDASGTHGDRRSGSQGGSFTTNRGRQRPTTRGSRFRRDTSSTIDSESSVPPVPPPPSPTSRPDTTDNVNTTSNATESDDSEAIGNKNQSTSPNTKDTQIESNTKDGDKIGRSSAWLGNPLNSNYWLNYHRDHSNCDSGESWVPQTSDDMTGFTSNPRDWDQQQTWQGVQDWAPISDNWPTTNTMPFIWTESQQAMPFEDQSYTAPFTWWRTRNPPVQWWRWPSILSAPRGYVSGGGGSYLYPAESLLPYSQHQLQKRSTDQYEDKEKSADQQGEPKDDVKLGKWMGNGYYDSGISPNQWFNGYTNRFNNNYNQRFNSFSHPPNRWNMWNSFSPWSRGIGWNQNQMQRKYGGYNSFFPGYPFPQPGHKDFGYPTNNQHHMFKRSTNNQQNTENQNDDVDVAKWLGIESHQTMSPRFWNRNSNYNNGFYNYYPQWWNMWNYKSQPWGNGWNSNHMWRNHGGQNSFYPGNSNLFSPSGNRNFGFPMSSQHTLHKRNTDDGKEDAEEEGEKVARWMEDRMYGRFGINRLNGFSNQWNRFNSYGYQPQWWNMWNTLDTWPQGNGWNLNQMWRKNDNRGSFFPGHYTPSTLQGFRYPMNSPHNLYKRSVDDQKKENIDNEEKVSRWMDNGQFGRFTPNRWNTFNNYNMLNRYGFHPQWWNSYSSFPMINRWGSNDMWRNYDSLKSIFPNGFKPYYHMGANNFNRPTRGPHVIYKRSTEDPNNPDAHKTLNMMGGYGGYWPQWWNMWNNFRYRPGYWNSWMWHGYYPSFFSEGLNEEESDKEHVLTKRSAYNVDQDQVSRMMGGYGGYWPQWWNSWNNYRYWPGYWNSQMWNSYYRYYPFYFSSQDSSTNHQVRMKRSANNDDKKDDSVSRMMGGYGGYWPQWWNMWNNYRHWPWYGNHWNSYNWMWNNNRPFFFAEDGQQGNDKEHVLSKRSADEIQEDQVSRMMGGYGGYWPQWWNMWNSYRYWPGYWNNRNWMWNYRYPFYFSKDKHTEVLDKEHMVEKRSTSNADREDVSRMMGGYGSHWSQQWNMWNNWPSYWNNWNNNWMWNNHWSGENHRNNYNWMPGNSNPFNLAKIGKQNNKKEHVLEKRNVNDKDREQLSRMMAGYGSQWPQQRNTWGKYRFWPNYWHNWNWMRNYRYPFYFSHGKNKDRLEKEHLVQKRSTTHDNIDQVSRMMGGYGGHWPQWWNMWNSYRYWPGHWNNWMSNNHYPFHFSNYNNEATSNKEHILSKRSVEIPDEHQMSRMMGGYGGYWPQRWNMWNNYRHWPWYGNHWNSYNWMWNNNRPFYFAKDGQQGNDKEHVLSKRSADDSQEDQVSRMMGGYGGYWPQWWNMWNNYRYWPGYWNNWMWNYRYPFYFSKDKDELKKEHIMQKRSTKTDDTDKVSKMMGGYGGYGGYWPQQWNMWNNWPGYWNNWNNNWMRSNRWSGWNHVNNYNWMSSDNNPFYFAADGKQNNQKEHILEKRSTDDDGKEQVSRMMGGYGGYWPQWWNMWNSYRYWPGYWNNWNWMWHHHYPFYFSKDKNEEVMSKEHIMRKRSADNDDAVDMSRMMGGYWPQQWNMKNNGPGYWNDWNNNWMYNNHWSGWNHKNIYNWMPSGGNPFYFAKDGNQDYLKEHILQKRSIGEGETDQVSRMMGGYGGYRPQWWNMWNNYRYWPGYWNNWNNGWMWNKYKHFYTYYPFYFSNRQRSMEPIFRNKRSTAGDPENDDISRMMGGYGGHWPQWWNMWNNYRHWPWYGNHWNSYNWMWNNNRPFYFAEDGQQGNDKEHVLSKRSADDSQEDQVSRMMGGYGGYGGYWPQQWNMWNNWPGYWNNWNNNWMRNNRWSGWNHVNKYNWMSSDNNPFHFAADGKQNNQKEHILEKRSTDDDGKEQVSRMMGGYGGYWPQWRNMWNNYRYWPGYYNNWMWNYRYPFYFSKDKDELEKEHIMHKRSTKTDDTDKVSRMMGGYGGYRPQWWNMRNSYRYWPGYWNNWNRMWHHHYPFYFSKDKNEEVMTKEHIMRKRSADNDDADDVSRMMGGYWPQQWNMRSNGPGYWNDWNNNWMYNNHWSGWNHKNIHNWMPSGGKPFYFAKDGNQDYLKEHILHKRSIGKGETDQVSRMMGGYGGYGGYRPQHWNMWNNWPGYWNNWNNNWMRSNHWSGWNHVNNYNWMSGDNNPFYFATDGKQDNQEQHILEKRSTDDDGKEQVSRMMGGYGGYWPQWWNMWNNYRYWPGYWNNWNRMWNNYYPFYFSKTNNEATSNKEHILSKRSAEIPDEHQMSRMMGGYGGYRPQSWNMWNSYRYWPGYWNNWMWNYRYPFYFSKDKDELKKEHIMQKRSTKTDDTDKISRMMGGYGGYGGYWPQHWNMWNNWPGYWNNWNNNWMGRNRWSGWNHVNNYNWMSSDNNPFYFATDGKQDNQKEHTLEKRSTDDDNQEQVSRMMGGYGGYWPQLWNMWNNYRYWPGYRNNWNNGWMWNNYKHFYTYYPFYFSSRQSAMDPNFRTKRSISGDPENEDISRMMGGYGGYWPQWWNMWNNYRHWPGYWNNWNWMWHHHYPFYFSKDKNTEEPGREHTVRKRSTKESNTDELSKMMDGYGHQWPQQWNMRNNWPGDWNNWNNNWMWNNNWFRGNENNDNHWMSGGNYPFYFDRGGEQDQKEHIVKKRHAGDRQTEEISRMMGGYGGYWPQWWNMWNSYRYWPGYWNNWMWNSYSPYRFSENNEEASDKEHIITKRNAENIDKNSLSRMMGGYGGYWPQWWNMWNNYRYWPGYWNNWNWMWNNYHPFYFSNNNNEATPNKEHILSKRSAEIPDEHQMSKMMVGYGGYWPQWRNMWNRNRYWPGYWNNWNNGWMWNNYPYYFSRGQNSMGSNMRTRRSTSEDPENEDISRMMGGYGGHWPQWWNVWNSYRYWPGYWNNWNWMWNSHWGNSHFFSHQDPQHDHSAANVHIITKRDTALPSQEEETSHMMTVPWNSGCNWSGLRNMWTNPRQWPRWMWNFYNQYFPYYSKEGEQLDPTSDKEHVLTKRSTDKWDEKLSQMRGGYSSHWPQWGQLRNKHWSSWNHLNNWMWNDNRNPFYFAEERNQNDEKEHILNKRSMDDRNTDQVSRMMSGYWPQRWNMWNNYRYWPGYWNNWMWNYHYPYYFTKDENQQDEKEHIQKRSTDQQDTDETSRMMGGHGGYWPQWWNMWNNYRRWPGYGNNWMWNNYRQFYTYYPFYFSRGQNFMGPNLRTKRFTSETPGTENGDISRMMGGYGGYWPRWWNMWNTYRHWPGYWNSKRNWNNEWRRNQFSSSFPHNFHYFSQNTRKGNGQHTIFKRNAKEADTDNSKNEENVAHMMSYYQHPSWPESWNMQGNHRYPSNYWNSRPHWSSGWNSNMWMWPRNQGQFPHNSLFDQQTMGPDFTAINGNQHHRWNPGNNMDSVLPFRPFAFSNDGKDVHQSPDTLFNKVREKRSSDSSLSENKTAENSTNSNNDTSSTSEPDVARQMSDYAGSSGNPYHQQWTRLYRSYLNSKRRYWRLSPYFSDYDDPYDIFYRNPYRNRYGRHYYIRYVMPWRAYRYWYRQMWNNRLLARQWMWNQNKYDPVWTDYGSRHSPFSYSWEDSIPDSEPGIRQQKDNADTPVEGEAQNHQDSGNTEEKRKKRSLDGMNFAFRYPYQQGRMFGYNNFHNNWPSWWGYGMYNYNYWPWWNYFWYSPMMNSWNWNNNWMWSGYNDQPFMYSQEQESSNMNTAEEKDANSSPDDHNKDATPSDKDRVKRSTEDQAAEPDTTNKKVSRWMNVPEQFYNQPMWKQNSWNSQMLPWMGGQHQPGFNYFSPEFTDRNSWNGNFMRQNKLNQPTDHDMPWNSMDNFSPFSFSEGDKETEEESPRERQERSAEETNPAQSYTDSADPEVARWMNDYPFMPAMSVGMYPWPPSMRQGWQHHGYNSQRQWMSWNRWGESKSWDNWNSAYTTSFPSFPLGFSSGEDITVAEKIRQKRSRDDSPDIQKEGSEDETEKDPKVSRMGMGFGRINSYPMGWKKHGPTFLNNRRWAKYNWPMFYSHTHMPWRSNWNGGNHFQPRQKWNQNYFNPQWNRPFWNWRNDGQMRNTNNFHNFQNKENPFNNEYVDESVLDPLSSFYFSQKDTKDKGNEDETLEKSMTEKTSPTESKTTNSQRKESRTKRRAVSLSKLLSKGKPQPEERKLSFSTMLKSNRKFAKRNVPYKVKRFSPKATARLQKRFQKRSPASTPDSTADGTKPPDPETAPKMLMHATAPARGHSTRDREWGPPTGPAFPSNPTTNRRLPDQNEIPNLNPNSNRRPNQGPESRPDLNPFGDYNDLNDWNWDRPGWDGNPNWLGEQDPEYKPDGQGGDGEGQDGQGPQDRSSDMTISTSTTTTTNTNTDSEPGINIPGGSSILNGDPRNRLSNYNYIDFNNPNYWNQFYNPASYNSTTGGPLGNATEWDNWFGLWAYGPNFWDDMNDLDLWDAPWGSGSWGMGPGGDQWSGGNWWRDPASGFSSSLPVEMGWETYWLDDCDDDYGDWSSGDLGYGPWNIRNWWSPEPEVTYVDLYPNDLYDGACRDCFRPVSPVPRRYNYHFRPTRYDARPFFYAFPPARSPYRPLRFFRPPVKPTGSSRGPWLKRFPGYPWDSYRKAQWSDVPWWGWNPNSFWNPWRYRIQYHNNMDHKVSRSRRAAASPAGLNTLRPTPTTTITTNNNNNKLAPTAATINTKRGSPILNPSLPSPFNDKKNTNQGLVGSKRFPGRLGPYFSPPLVVGPYNNHNNDGRAGWGIGGNPSSGSESSPLGNGWDGLPWWDKNNWHLVNARDDLAGLPDGGHLVGPRNVFTGVGRGGPNAPSGMGGGANFPAGLAGNRNFPAGMDGAGNIPPGMAGTPDFPPRPSGMAGNPNFPPRPSGMAGTPNFPPRPSGMAGTPNFPSRPSGMAGTPNFPPRPSGMAGTPNFPSRPSGMAGNLNFPSRPSGMAGTPNFPPRPPGMAGNPNFPSRPSGMAGNPNFPSRPSGMAGTPDFPPRPPGMAGGRNFPEGLGQGRGGGHWHPPTAPFPQHTGSGRPATPWHKGKFFRPPGTGFHPGPLRQEGGHAAGDAEEEAAGSRRSSAWQPVTPSAPWNPSPWNMGQSAGKDGGSSSKANTPEPAGGDL